MQLWQIPLPDSEAQRRLSENHAELQRRLQQIADQHHDARFASSLAAEDLVIHHALHGLNTNISVFSLETGRLNRETLELIESVRNRYPNIPIKLYHPDATEAAAYEREHGRDAFYHSLELRRECCRIRKIAPLNRALHGADAWLTGQRREQSATRTELPFAEHDSARGIAKYNPIYDWTEQDVWAYILAHDIPFNPLYHQGYPSIGCEPCTLPVKAGDDIRAGRWWWEQRDSKECGLHK